MEDEVKNEVQEMNKSFGYEATEEPESGTEPEPEPNEPEENEPKPEEEPEGEEEEEETSEEEPEEGAEEEEPKPEPELEPGPEEDERDKTIAELRRKLDEKEAKEEPEPEPEPEKEEPITFEAQSFIPEETDLEDLISDPKSLNEVLNNVYQRAVTDTRKVLGEGILRSIPDIVRSNVDVMDKLKQMNDKFYKDNEDLKPFRKVVAAVFEEIASDNPGKDIMELLPNVADESRKRLELHKQAAQTKDRKLPRLPKKKRRTSLPEEKPNTNPLLSELEEMNKSIRR